MHLLGYGSLHIYTLKSNNKMHKLLCYFSENSYKLINDTISAVEYLHSMFMPTIILHYL